MFSKEEKECIQEYIDSDKLFIKLKDNEPNFTNDEIRKGSKEPFEKYSELDEGRCGSAFACIIGEKLVSIDKPKFKSRIKPTAWKSIGCDYIEDGKCLYNRCHLIGRQLATKKVSKEGLITGTRKFNIEGMFKFEDEVANYIKNNQNHHVLYRVTPYFGENNLLAYGVKMEIMAIEDKENFMRNVFVYNKQPGFTIDYRIGEVYSDKPLSLSGKRLDFNIYVLDMKTKKFYKEHCMDACDIRSKMYFVGQSETLIKKGYSLC